MTDFKHQQIVVFEHQFALVGGECHHRIGAEAHTRLHNALANKIQHHSTGEHHNFAVHIFRMLNVAHHRVCHNK